MAGSCNHLSNPLWHKGGNIDSLMRELTVGNDPDLDRALVVWDCIGSAAHARMLASIGVLDQNECGSIINGLKEIKTLAEQECFEIRPEQEDCHTAIENFLSAKTGEAGKKIHTGRSRNDQVVLAMRLFCRNSALHLMGNLADLAEIFLSRARELAHIPMPGYTHLQPAMPSNVGLWLASFGEGLLEQLRDGFNVLDMLDANPLGAAAGSGSGLPLNRALTASLLGFSGVQRNPIDVNNSRGRKEARLLQWITQTIGVLEKFAWDVLLFSTREFGFLSLPPELTTGSSIMPQKRNLDVVELLRGRAGKLRGIERELSEVTARLPSSYHRDLQYTKEPVMRAVMEAREALRMARLIVPAMILNEQRLRASMYTDLYATWDAFKQVRAGVPFRDAYRRTAEKVSDGSLSVGDVQEYVEQAGRELESCLREAQEELAGHKGRLASIVRRISEAESSVL